MSNAAPPPPGLPPDRGFSDSDLDWYRRLADPQPRPPANDAEREADALGHVLMAREDAEWEAALAPEAGFEVVALLGAADVAAAGITPAVLNGATMAIEFT